MSVHSPEGVRHINEILIGGVCGKCKIWAGGPVHITGHNLSDFDECALEVVPRRVVDVVHSLEALLVVLIEIAGVVVVNVRPVEEFPAGAGSQRKGTNKDNIEYFIGFHRIPVLESDVKTK